MAGGLANSGQHNDDAVGTVFIVHRSYWCAKLVVSGWAFSQSQVLQQEMFLPVPDLIEHSLLFDFTVACA